MAKKTDKKTRSAEPQEDDSYVRPGFEDWDPEVEDPEAERLAGIFKRLRKHFRG